MLTEKQKDMRASKIVIYVGLAILATVLAFIIFGSRSDCGIDKANLPCRWTGTIADIFGLVIFIAGALWLFGLGNIVVQFFTKKKGDVYFAEGPHETINGWIGIIAAIIGMGIIFLN